MSVIFPGNETVWPKPWPQINISWSRDLLMDEHHSWYNGSVWHRDWPHQVYEGQWPIFYGPVILLHILKTIWWTNIVFGIMDQCDTKINLVKYMWVSDLYFMVHWFCLISCHRLKLFLYFKKWCQPGVLVSLRALAPVCFQSKCNKICLSRDLLADLWTVF